MSAVFKSRRWWEVEGYRQFKQKPKANLCCCLISTAIQPADRPQTLLVLDGFAEEEWFSKKDDGLYITSSFIHSGLRSLLRFILCVVHCLFFRNALALFRFLGFLVFWWTHWSLVFLFVFGHDGLEDVFIVFVVFLDLIFFLEFVDMS